LEIDPERLGEELAVLAGGERDEFSDSLYDMAAQIAERFIVKRGKIDDFSMQIVGSSPNVLPRSMVSHALGPYGFNLHPTVEKILIDTKEAVREIPYLAFGPQERILAPDVLSQLKQAYAAGAAPEDFMAPTPLFLSFLDEMEDDNLHQSVYDILTEDKYFRGKVGSFDELVDFQRFVRNNPMTRQMEDLLAPFFQAPISVGVRDTVRWALGSRHPEIGWDKALETIHTCFASHGEENFLPVEINYYGLDVDQDAEKLRALFDMNATVVELFARDLDEALKGHGFVGFDSVAVRKLAAQVLEFHHGYPAYELEPYQGVLSISTLKMGVRIIADLLIIAARMQIPEKKNRNLSWLAGRPGTLVTIVAAMDEDARDKFFGSLETALRRYMKRGGVRDDQRKVWTYGRVPRTFYSFQEKAHYSASRMGRVEETISLEQLNTPEYRGLLKEIPELAEKLTVFFMLVLRYFKDTGFVPDLRPSNAGRDVLVLGIWGHVSDNLLITIWRDNDDQRRAALSFVDNKDQFKEYRREEDRQAPVGLAKHALRLTSQVAEPGMLRAIGIFSEIAANNLAGVSGVRSSVIDKYTTRGLDILHEVVHAAVEQFFDSTRIAVEDVVDDLFTGLKKWLKL